MDFLANDAKFSRGNVIPNPSCVSECLDPLLVGLLLARDQPVIMQSSCPHMFVGGVGNFEFKLWNAPRLISVAGPPARMLAKMTGAPGSLLGSWLAGFTELSDLFGCTVIPMLHMTYAGFTLCSSCDCMCVSVLGSAAGPRLVGWHGRPFAACMCGLGGTDSPPLAGPVGLLRPTRRHDAQRG